MKGHFAWEYKGQGKYLDDAYVQLLRYKDDLGNPPLMVVSDLNIIRIHMQNLHATLDRAVWAAYGWPSDEIPAEVEEDVVLSRLLALNLERARQE